MNNEELFKELDLIQSCINRMANNSFMVKGWAIAIYSITFATISEQIAQKPMLLICIIISVLGFWYTDAFFLYTEKKYRKLYEWVLVERKKGNIENQYSLNTNNINPHINMIKVFFSKSLSGFYGLTTLIIILILTFTTIIKS